MNFKKLNCENTNFESWINNNNNNNNNDTNNTNTNNNNNNNNNNKKWTSGIWTARV